ncbi:MAG: TadE/TadG family type IV pilus assembly protein [Paracoccaceae bacterium]
MIRRLNSIFRKFRTEERGAVVVDFIPVFFCMIVVVLVIFEIGIAYFLSLRAYKAAQLGARAATVVPAVHPDVPPTNVRVNPVGELGVPCLDPRTNPASSRCVDPGGPWVCNGANLGPCAANSDDFLLIVRDMQRTFPDLEPDEVTVSYIYRGLGETGGNFVPEVNVRIQAQAYRFVIFRLGSDQPGTRPQQLVSAPATRYGGVSASAFPDNPRRP